MTPGREAFMEPSVHTLAGRTPARTAKRYLLATRPMFFPASVLPVLVGTSWGAAVAGALDVPALLLGLAATVCVHAGINVLNDVYDDLNGADRNNAGCVFPYTGGSRFIQNQVLSRQQMGVWAGILIALAVALGAALYALKGLAVVWFGLAGLALGILYSVPPVALASRGLGEAAVAAGFGLLPVVGAAWLQSGEVGWAAVVLSLPVSIWVANILLLNEVPDAIADASAGKRTLVVRLGAPRSGTVYATLSVIAVIAAFSFGVYAHLPPWGFLPLLVLMFLGLDVGRRVIGVGDQDGVMRRAIEVTLTIHALGCIWLGTWIWI